MSRLLTMLLLCFSALYVSAQYIGDGPVVKEHMSQDDINGGGVVFDMLMSHGELLFTAKFNKFDGQGRPGATGTGAARVPGTAPEFIRTSAPESNSCAGCHNDPFPGAAGDIVANVFVLAQALDPVTESVNAMFSNDRNTLGMHGGGPIEMLAREISADLLVIQSEVRAMAAMTGEDATKALYSKGIYYGTITSSPDGTIDTSGVEGVDADLIIKPFHQKGAVISMRQFTNNAMNHHHGMQSVERFGPGDFDQDGVEDELTVGDITAATLWQAALGTPGQVIPSDGNVARAIIRGENTFEAVGCAGCHMPSLMLDSPEFSEPSPFNPAGNLQVIDVPEPYTFDMTVEGFKPRPERTHDGRVIVRAYTDLKRHNLCDDDYNHYCNEQVEQDGIPTEMFLTRKLWDVGNTAPYGHRGDLTTITEAIWYHGGEARTSRDAFFNLPDSQQAEVIEFLKSLQILPEGTEHLVVDEHGNYKNKRKLAKSLQTSKPGQQAQVGGQ